MTGDREADEEDPGSSSGGFWRAEASEQADPIVDWARRPGAHAAAFVVLGGFGVFLEQASFLFQVVVGAPVFEELLKFGVALGLATLLRLGSRPLRFGAAVAVGAAFGGLEHAVTYPGEALAALRFRVAFHAGTPALSMAVYDAVHPVHDPRVRWAATVPATVLHWANNAVAVALGLAGLAAGEIPEGTSLIVGQVIAGIVLGLALAGLLLPDELRRGVVTLWDRFAPRQLRSPDHGSRGTDLPPRRPGP